MEYPELNGKQWVAVQIKLKGQENWRCGMFYINCGKPVFASYGSEVTDKVTEWRYWEKVENDSERVKRSNRNIA